MTLECLRCGAVDPETVGGCVPNDDPELGTVDHVLVHSKNVDRFLNGKEDQIPPSLLHTIRHYSSVLNARYRPSHGDLMVDPETIEVPPEEE